MACSRVTFTFTFLRLPSNVEVKNEQRYAFAPTYITFCGKRVTVVGSLLSRESVNLGIRRSVSYIYIYIT